MVRIAPLGMTGPLLSRFLPLDNLGNLDNTVKQSSVRISNLCFAIAMTVTLCLLVSSCIHPKVALRKSRLVDPMMDPAQAAPFGEILAQSLQGQFEKAATGGSGVGGGSCPTCK